MRDRSVREIKEKRAHILAVAQTHQVVLNCLFAELLTSEHAEDAVALEFFRAYRHLFDGSPLDEVPLQLIDKKGFLRRVEEILSGKRLILDEDEEDQP